MYVIYGGTGLGLTAYEKHHFNWISSWCQCEDSTLCLVSNVQHQISKILEWKHIAMYVTIVMGFPHGLKNAPLLAEVLLEVIAC